MIVRNSCQTVGRCKLNVVLVRPQIPQNTGSIGRTCLAFGARLHLIGPYGFSLSESSVRRAGLDYWKHVDLKVYANWSDFEERVWESLKRNAFFFTKYGKNSLTYVDFKKSKELVPLKGRKVLNMDLEDVTLVFGSETRGLHVMLGEEMVNRFPTVFIPMIDNGHRKDDMPSYNLAASVAMVLWEAYRQTQRKGV